MKTIVDTNAYTRLLRGDADILAETTKSEKMYLSVIVIGELCTGFRGGHKLQENMTNLEDFLARPTTELLQITKETAYIFGEIRFVMIKKGMPLPVNDIWIAAHAVETGSVLITYDRHFLHIPGLRVWDTLKPSN